MVWLLPGDNDIRLWREMANLCDAQNFLKCCGVEICEQLRPCQPMQPSTVFTKGGPFSKLADPFSAHSRARQFQTYSSTLWAYSVPVKNDSPGGKNDSCRKW